MVRLPTWDEMVPPPGWGEALSPEDRLYLRTVNHPAVIRLLKAWPILPEHARQTILAIVETTIGKDVDSA
jgi:hypothetical protein